MKKVIFLDIDGVLTNRESIRKRYEYYKKYKVFISVIDEKTIKRLSKIVVITGAKIVLSSVWRGDWKNGKENLFLEQSKFLQALFDKYNIEVIGITPCVPKSSNLSEIYTSWRENEILNYLNTHTEIESFCVIDDEDFDLQKLIKYLVLTNQEEGLEDEHVEEAIKILTKKFII